MTIEQIILEVAKIVGSLLVGGFIGVKIGVNKNIKQTQKGGDNASMTQIGENHHG
jgi:hypothetical protein